MTDKTVNQAPNSFPGMEEEVLNFWEKANIFEKSVKKDAPKGNYIFNDGPPFITGLPHYATLLPSIAKDVVPRYWTMKGYRVERVWGWDCHGLPAENKVEEQLELKNKKDIDTLGVDKFVDACRAYVDKGSEQWEWYINRIGRWVDMKHAYKTMDLNYMESVIWAFKKLFDDGFIYEGYRSSLHCPRCATPLSKFEITMDAGSYKDVTDKTVVVKFRITNYELRIKDENIDGDIYMLAWTTTPWTLPGNLALAVNEDNQYVILKINKIIKNDTKLNIKEKETYIIESGDSFRRIFDININVKTENQDYSEVDNIKFVNNNKDLEIEVGYKIIGGKDLVGLSYEPIYELNSEKIKNSENVYKIYAADFVTTEDGTGVVHIAPNFGEDDFDLGKKVGLPIVDLMDETGTYLEVAGKWKDYYFKKANRDVLIDLEERNVIFSSFDVTHSYPFCYRCSTPLIYKTQKAWYLDVQKIKERMLETNKEINWVPEFFKEGRFQKNIESAPDWCLSRSRYWGSPIPVWKCADCGEIKVVGSIKEIEELSGAEIKDLHRPIIDAPKFKCKCGGEMERVKEVFDCWFESGAMPFAQFHYPFEKQEGFKNMFPADFIIEYTGQLRGWFYYLHVLSNALFDSVSFKNVIVSGVLAGTDGRKMSKSYGNYPDPRATLEKYGSDALRMYFMSSSIMLGDDTSLSEDELKDALRKNVMVLWNVVKFYELFETSPQPSPSKGEVETVVSENVLDQWILIRFSDLLKEVTENLEKYNLPLAARPITAFIDDLSTWYLRRSRDRFKGDDEKDKGVALATTKFILIELSKVMAPFAPFIAEQIWQKVSGNNFQDEDKSVHLEEWSSVVESEKLKVESVLVEMEMVRKIVELGLSKRDEASVKIKQPLSQLIINNLQTTVKDEYLELIKDEINVKEVVQNKGEGEMTVELDLTITPELKLEGVKREVVRFVNALRKDADLSIGDRAELYYETESEIIKEALEKFAGDIMNDTLCDAIKFGLPAEASAKEGIEHSEINKEVKIDGEVLKLGINKL